MDNLINYIDTLEKANKMISDLEIPYNTTKYICGKNRNIF